MAQCCVLIRAKERQPESGAGQNPVFANDGICCENVESPGVDVRQDPLQFLLQRKYVARASHLLLEIITKEDYRTTT